jgi:hypothetical protein
MKDWKTTVCGIVAAVGAYLVNSQTGWLNVVGQVLSSLGVLLVGLQAKDAK